MERRNRKHSKIDKLPPDLRDTVEQMMQSNFTYAEIADYIRDHGFEISITSVYRHAKMAQENFRVVMEEVAKYPQLDTTEGIIRLLSHQVMEAIQNTTEEQWKNIDPSKLVSQATGLVKAASYKANMDIKNKDILDAGLEQVKVLVFESMAKEQPELYAEVSKFISDKQAGGAD